VRRRPGVRMLSVGCATGQEPHCMAIAALHAGWCAEQVVIEAFDRNPESLRIAAEGRYGAASIRGEVPGWATPFLHHDPDCVRIDAGVRGMVRFAPGDVSTWRPSGRYDVVFCRNLLIYLNAAARSELIGRLCGSLATGGLLFVGHAEQAIRGHPLRVVPASHAFAFERVEDAATAADLPRGGSPRLSVLPKRPADAAPGAESPPPPAVPARSAEEMLGEARDLADAGRAAESASLLRALIARYGPSAAALELLGLIGMAGEDPGGARRLFEQAVYLEPGRSASLLQLAMICERAGDTTRAASYWARAGRAADPDRPEPRT
jgi:chemotaxis protein methyltransferase WspC